MANEYSQIDTSKNANRDCTALESLLTAFFDGECSASEAAHVRAHLAACADCTRAFEQWQSTRALFQIQPLPVPPASLLARVRLAYRRAPQASEAAIEAEIRDQLLLEETLLEAARGLEPDPFTPPLRAFFADVEAPATLQTEILKKTVGAPLEVRAPLSQSTPDKVSSIVELLQSLLNPAPLRWASAVAVPAAAAWLLLTSVSPQIPMEPGVLESGVPDSSTLTQTRRQTRAALPSTPEAAKLARVIPTPDLKKLLPSSVLSPSLPKIAKLPVIALPKLSAPRTNQTPESEQRPEPRIAAVRYDGTSDTVPDKSTPVAAKRDDVSRENEPKLQLVDTRGEPARPTKITPPRTERVKPLIARRPRFDPRIRELNINERTYAQAPVNLGRMTSMRPISMTTPPPIGDEAVPTSNRVAIKFEEAVADFQRLRSPQDEELKRVVNDYRASLASEGDEEENVDDLL